MSGCSCAVLWDAFRRLTGVRPASAGGRSMSGRGIAVFRSRPLNRPPAGFAGCFILSRTDQGRAGIPQSSTDRAGPSDPVFSGERRRGRPRCRTDPAEAAVRPVLPPPRRNKRGCFRSRRRHICRAVPVCPAGSAGYGFCPVSSAVRAAALGIGISRTVWQRASLSTGSSRAWVKPASARRSHWLSSTVTARALQKGRPAVAASSRNLRRISPAAGEASLPCAISRSATSPLCSCRPRSSCALQRCGRACRPACGPASGDPARFPPRPGPVVACVPRARPRCRPVPDI